MSELFEKKMQDFQFQRTGLEKEFHERELGKKSQRDQA